MLTYVENWKYFLITAKKTAPNKQNQFQSWNYITIFYNSNMPNRMATQMVKYSQEQISVWKMHWPSAKCVNYCDESISKRPQINDANSHYYQMNKMQTKRNEPNMEIQTHGQFFSIWNRVFFPVVCIFLFIRLFGNKSQVNISSEHTNLWSFIFAHTNMVFRFIKPRTDHLEIGFIYSLLLLFLFPLSLKQTENWIYRKVKHVI